MRRNRKFFGPRQEDNSEEYCIMEQGEEDKASMEQQLREVKSSG